jgi:glycosyltransferase involved in cell wall biosynthesis
MGHLSNLSREKGIAIVLDCLRVLVAQGVEVELWLAGPAENKDTEKLIAAARAEFGERLKYLGRLDGEEVRRFYQDIDVFLFPTDHKHEAEPLVVIDAVAAGVPVISTDRGCIGYLLDMAGGRVFAVEDFLERAVEQIVAWAREPPLLTKASREARSRYLELYHESQAQFGQLVTMILRSEQSAVRRDGTATHASPPKHDERHSSTKT